MPKLIDYPRTSYSSAWEIAETVDDTGGKCGIETCARKLNRKVSGSFKAIIGSAVKFGLLTSKREQLATTTLFRRIKHAYDKQEELLFHREAFLTPPLFTQLCRKFRGRELPMGMLDVLLIREFEVEEINGQNVAKAFIDGARMVGLLDEYNIVADIDQLAANQPPRRELASPQLLDNKFKTSTTQPSSESLPQTEITNTTLKTPQLNDYITKEADAAMDNSMSTEQLQPKQRIQTPIQTPIQAPKDANSSIRNDSLKATDAITSLFALPQNTNGQPFSGNTTRLPTASSPQTTQRKSAQSIGTTPTAAMTSQPVIGPDFSTSTGYRLELTGPGINTQLDLTEADDLVLARALLNKIERLLRTS